MRMWWFWGNKQKKLLLKSSSKLDVEKKTLCCDLAGGPYGNALLGCLGSYLSNIDLLQRNAENQHHTKLCQVRTHGMRREEAKMQTRKNGPIELAPSSVLHLLFSIVLNITYSLIAVLWYHPFFFRSFSYSFISKAFIWKVCSLPFPLLPILPPPNFLLPLFYSSFSPSFSLSFFYPKTCGTATLLPLSSAVAY